MLNEHIGLEHSCKVLHVPQKLELSTKMHTDEPNINRIITIQGPQKRQMNVSVMQLLNASSSNIYLNHVLRA